MSCPKCSQKKTGPDFWTFWYKPRYSKHFQNGFDKWASGNNKIDKFIQDVQPNANDLKMFSTIHNAKWINGTIDEWDIENQQWKRNKRNCQNSETEVTLKKFDNFVNINDVLNEMGNHLITNSIIYYMSIKFYGITQDPEIHSHIMVLQYAKDGNLREYVKTNFNNINWSQKLYLLLELSLKMMKIHELDIVHQDFHPGNILSSDKKSIQI
ncbi:hypothetical protein Glove_606g178 [Diversispora epigaea]|uniref:Protein kinase domain-containing protein n=1 Tax=Diversispora epigaea TaxID=1348612 RepID=A0A397GBL5_9GLOM|nr:hypothetical protein Glove_606g178 [Diversispora epigaea]